MVFRGQAHRRALIPNHTLVRSLVEQVYDDKGEVLKEKYFKAKKR